VRGALGQTMVREYPSPDAYHRDAGPLADVGPTEETTANYAFCPGGGLPI